MAIAGGKQVTLLANPGVTDTMTVDLIQPRIFVASIMINYIDPVTTITRPSAVAADIISWSDTLSVSPSTQAFGGDHLGSQGASTNLFHGCAAGFGQFVTFRLRSFGSELTAAAAGVVFF
jgi:hypothetical protein